VTSSYALMYKILKTCLLESFIIKTNYFCDDAFKFREFLETDSDIKLIR